MVAEVALSLSLLPAVATEPVAEPSAESISLPQNVLDMLEAKGVDLASLPSEMGVVYDRSLRLFSSEQAAAVVRQFLTSTRFPSGRENELPPKQLEAVRLRLRGLGYREIGRRVGVTGTEACRRVGAAIPLLESETKKRLAALNKSQYGIPLEEERKRIIALYEGGMPASKVARLFGRDKDTIHRVLHEAFPGRHFPRGKLPDAERAKRVAAAFWEEWKTMPLPLSSLGVQTKIARRLGITFHVVVLDLKREGIDFRGESLKKRLLFLLETARTLEEPFEATKIRLGVSRRVLTAYRKYAWEGVHLRWARELAETSEVEWFWEISEPQSGQKKPFNIGRRNKVVLSELKQFDKDLARLKGVQRLTDPAIQFNREREASARRRRESVAVQIREAEERRRRTILNERQFRKQYALPSMDILEGPER